MEAAAENPKLLLDALALVANVPENKELLTVPKDPPCLFLSFKNSKEELPDVNAVEADEGSHLNNNPGDAWTLRPDPLPELKVGPD